MTRLVLASASAGRLQVLRQAGVDPLVVVSGVDEDALIAGLGPDAAPDSVVGELARAKAERVAGELDGGVAADCVVLGCDSMLEVDGQLCGKPQSAAAAVSQWQLMAGRAGRLHTGHCLLRLRDGMITHREVQSGCTTVHFGTP
ncbi:MAG: Maf family protein, partial [Mycobacterium sp.]|uniref:Maf family protein n=1 Tax=Mycobacterium sp. TaxID=1785 RepID=UPI001EB52906